MTKVGHVNGCISSIKYDEDNCCNIVTGCYNYVAIYKW